MAHLDTVFPDETGFELVEEDGWLKAPGVGDDTANVALLMVITRYLLEQKCPPKQGVLIVLKMCIRDRCQAVWRPRLEDRERRALDVVDVG